MARNPILATGGIASEPVEAVTSLVARAKAGDSAAFVLIYRHYVNGVYAFTARRLSGREAAEDATQEIFTRALAGIGRCRDDAAFPGWLVALARHVVTEQYKAGRHATSSLDGAAEPVDPDLSPEERVLSREGADELRQARERCMTDRDGMVVQNRSQAPLANSRAGFVCYVKNG